MLALSQLKALLKEHNLTVVITGCAVAPALC